MGIRIRHLIRVSAPLYMGTWIPSQRCQPMAEELKGNQFEGKETYVKDVFEEIAEYYDKIENFEKAKEKYKRLIFEYPNSIYSSQARKRYRELDNTSVNP